MKCFNVHYIVADEYEEKLEELTKRFNEANNTKLSDKEIIQFALTKFPNTEVLLKYIEFRTEEAEDNNKLRLAIKKFFDKYKKTVIKEE